MRIAKSAIARREKCRCPSRSAALGVTKILATNFFAGGVRGGEGACAGPPRVGWCEERGPGSAWSVGLLRGWLEIESKMAAKVAI